MTALLVVMGVCAPASAGTLTSATFTAAGPYTYTSASNTRYDWAFRTATTGTLGSVRMSVPPGTGVANKYLDVSASNGNYASTPDSATNSANGDLDIRVKMAPKLWANGVNAPCFMRKFGSTGDQSWAFCINASGTLTLGQSSDGTSVTWITSNADVTSSTTNGVAAWVRATLQLNNGSGGKTYTFYTSSNGTNWTSVGTAITTAGTTSVFDSTAPIIVQDFNSAPLVGKIYSAEVHIGIPGTTVSPSGCGTTNIVSCFNANDATASSPSTWNSSSAFGESWSVTRSGTNFPADIAGDLAVVDASGIPTGGTARVRLIDGVAVYVPPSAVSVPASTMSTLSLQGFTNTATAGSYSSLIATYNNSATPVMVDSVTTATLVFTSAGSATAISATVDPSFTFGVTNRASVCNGESNFLTGSGTSTSVDLAHLTAGNNVSGGQSLSVATNTNGGFTVFIRATQSSTNLRSAAHNWVDATGTYASPAALSGEAFGYTYKDSSGSSNVVNPSNALFIALDATNRAVMGSTSALTGSGCVSFDAQSTTVTPAGSYSATVIYSAVPTF